MIEKSFDEAFFKKLERLRLRARPQFLSRLQGERLARHTGASSDFLGFREYTQGDDVRYVDWKALARLDRLIVKQFRAEDGLDVHLMIDTSRSMGLGHPSKLDYAAQIAAALSYIGLYGQDRVALTFFDRALRRVMAPLNGKRHFVPLLKQLMDVKPSGQTDMAAALGAYAERTRSSGLAIIISDLVDDGEGYEAGLLSLVRRGFSICVLHTFAPEELSPQFQGSVRAVDVENGGELEITADEKTYAHYRHQIGSFCAKANAFCSDHGIGYQRIASDTSLEDTLFKKFRQGRILQ